MQQITVGRYRIRLGRFEVSLPEIVEISDIQKLKERISKFNRKLNISNENTYFCVTLLSDAIITDKYMRYKSFIEPGDMGIKDAEPILGIAEIIPVQGWNSMAKIPKEDMVAIEKGSVFVFRTKKIDDILYGLYEAEVSGIGKRRGEGFGRLIVCDPFHSRDGPI
jgi:CRISPR-associated Csx10 family RAMP protein